MGWTFVWLMVALKVPIAALLYIVHWAAKPPEDAEQPSSDDGGVKPPHRPVLPRHPRHRGPHGAPGAAPSPRVRKPTLQARAATRHHP